MTQISSKITDSAVVDRSGSVIHLCARDGVRYATALLRNPSDAEEAVQEAFCRLHKANAAEHETGYRGRFFATLRNHCIDLIRRQKVRREVFVGTAIESTNYCPQTSLESKEIIRAVEYAVNQLPADWKQALQLRVHGNLSYREVAEIMAISKSQVRTWIFRARRQLEDVLSAKGIIETETADPGLLP